VTGSAHCSLAVLWSPKFGGAGTEWKASQGNAKQRTGALRVVWDGKLGNEGGRVRIIGSVVQSKWTTSTCLRYSTELLRSKLLRETCLSDCRGIIYGIATGVTQWQHASIEVVNHHRH
jgi:hypothetical protein